jgi:hypothetical protein
MSAVVGSQYGATSGPAESLIAQLYSPDAKIEKFDMKTN